MDVFGAALNRQLLFIYITSPIIAHIHAFCLFMCTCVSVLASLNQYSVTLSFLKLSVRLLCLCVTVLPTPCVQIPGGLFFLQGSTKSLIERKTTFTFVFMTASLTASTS